MKSDAVKFLAALPGSQQELAERFGVTQGAMSRYLLGTSAPTRKGRIRIHERGGPRPESWDTYSELPPAPARELPAIHDDEEPPEATPELSRQLANRTLAELNAELERIRSRVEEIPGSRARELTQLAQGIKALGSITGMGILSENMILQSPAWRELCRVILDALRPHPAALESVIQALAAREAK